MENLKMINTADELKALAHPTRLKILALLGKKEKTNKQIAVSLNEPPAKVHFHSQVLLKCGLITPVRQEIKGGIVEKYYRAAAKNLVLSSELYNMDSNVNVSLVESILKTAQAAYTDAVLHFNHRPPITQVFQTKTVITRESYLKIEDYMSKIRDELNRDVSLENPKNLSELIVTYIAHATDSKQLGFQEGDEDHGKYSE